MRWMAATVGVSVLVAGLVAVAPHVSGGQHAAASPMAVGGDDVFRPYGTPVDDTRLTIGGTVVDADGFEADGGAWAVEGPPAGSPPGIHGNFAIAEELISVAASVATEDTALLGFGIESLATAPEQADVLGRVIKPLLRR